jgi:precorrin-6B methylase 2
MRVRSLESPPALEVHVNKWNRVAVGLAFALTVSSGHAQVPATVRQEEAAREGRQRVADIFAAMTVRPGAVVADVGAGSGFLTVRLAQAVGASGRVIAVDTDKSAIARLQARVQQEGLPNVDIVQGTEDDPRLAPESLDAIVIVNAYHEMRAYQAMLRHFRRALKPKGRLVIVEPLSDKRRHDSREAQVRVHEIGLQFVEQEAREAGFRIARTEDPFTEQGSDAMWLLVATPDLLASTGASRDSPTTPGPPSRSETTTGTGEDSATSRPELRIAFERFKELQANGEITVVDVRSEREYRAGHIPGATLIPLEDLGEQITRLRDLGRPVVTYCS